MTPRPAAELVLIGAALGAFGVRGEVRVRTFTTTPEAVAAYGPLYDKVGRLLLTPKRARPIKDGVALTGPEVRDRDAAEALKGEGLYVPRSVLPPAEEDEFYHVDLIGCRVEGLDGAPLGEVRAVRDFGAGDLLEIAPHAGGSVWYLPFTKAETPIVDIPARRIVADPALADPDDTPQGGGVA